MKTNDSDEIIIRSILGISALTIGVAMLPVTIYWFIAFNQKGLRNKVNYRTLACLTLFVMIGLIGCSYFYNDILSTASWRNEHVFYNFKAIQVFGGLTKLISGWLICGFASYLITPLVLKFKKTSNGIRTQDFENKIQDFSEIKKHFFNPTLLPIGINLKNGEVVGLNQTQRTAHVLTVGATGTGKTTAMINMILHAVANNLPCVVIDPKGEDSTLEEVIRIGRKLVPDFDEKFELFSMSKPQQSFKYNPLKHGNANQLKDRIMEAFTWSEQYYQSIAGSFLTELTATTEYLGLCLNLDRISKILRFKEEQAEILKKLRDRFQESGDQYALNLYNNLSTFFNKSKEDALSGLNAQITILNNPTFGGLLSFDNAISEIDFRDSRKKSKIAYFQLDTLGNADSARRLGRMIIEDLKSLASEVYKTEPDSRTRIFFPVFIDEFGSFATREFIEFLKQSRGANFGIHLFCQGLEDLDSVSPEFRRQVISNTMTKIGLRMDDNQTVNEICATAGTFDAIEQSFQVEGTLLPTKTGMGNQRFTKQMYIEHDVFKQLKLGQAVIIQKSPSRVSGIQLFKASELKLNY